MSEKPTEGIFLEITLREREVIERVVRFVGCDYSPNGIVRAFFALDKYLTVINTVRGKEKLSTVISKFMRG